MLINDYILRYHKGYKYERLNIYDMISLRDPNQLLYFANKYNVTPESYNTTNKDVSDYLDTLGDYYDSFCDLLSKIYDDSNRLSVFLFIIIPIECVLAMVVSQLLFATSIRELLSYISGIAVLLSTRFQGRKFENWFRNKRKEKFLKRNHIPNNHKVINFVNEVLFQVYLNNRNPQKENIRQDC